MSDKMKRNNRTQLAASLAKYSLAAGAAMAAGAAQQVDAAIISETGLDHDFGAEGSFQLTMEGTNWEFEFNGRSEPGDLISYHNFTAGGAIGFFSMAYEDGPRGSIARAESPLTVDSGLAWPPYGGNQLFYYLKTGNNTYTSTGGNWTSDGQAGYMPIKFRLDQESASGLAAGSTVYGWIEVERVDKNSGKILGWAYEDSGDSIQAGAVPEPNAFALLALGAAGLGTLRRRRHG